MIRPGLRLCSLTVLALLVAGAASVAPGPAWAQKAKSAAPAPKPTDKLMVEANELVYDKEKDTVSAVGNAQLYYQGRTLEADRVIYDRKSKRVFAEGNARIIEANGTKYFGDRFELTDDFKNGFIDSLRSQSPDKQRFSAARAERTEGETSVFERGTYTPCEPCKTDPKRPPLWQIRAARIIHKTSEQAIYYEQATLEFWGVPIAYMPFFSGPDPSVNRKTGFLMGRITNKKSLGTGVSAPFFWALAPNMDVLLTPTYYSRQGFLGQAEFRHRLQTGTYTLRIAGINQNERDAFLPGPLGAGDRKFRGSVETTGQFYINEKWKWGWDLAAATDRFFFRNYSIKTDAFRNTYQGEFVSQVYLNGQGERSWFDLRAQHFTPATNAEWLKNQAHAHPVLDYDRRFSSSFIGGEVQLTANLTSLSRSAAHFQALPTPNSVGHAGSPNIFSGTAYRQNGAAFGYGLYEGCNWYTRTNCILRGMSGNSTRATVALSWRRSFIDPVGQVWTPFASVRGDVLSYNLDTTRYVNAPLDNAIWGNDKLTNFVRDSSDVVGRVMPTVGVTYRFPFIAFAGNITHQIEPIAQIIARPNERRATYMPNEDAQSLVFDDTVLFSTNKFSGYDRTEGGVRANYGFQYTMTAASGASMNVLVGQSNQLGGRNSYSTPDASNTGLNSGLEKHRSDFVGRIAVSPVANLNFSARGRFDEDTFKLRRLEIGASASTGPVSLSTSYARLAPQPMLGYNLPREGWSSTLSLRLPSNWYASSSITFDMDRRHQDRSYHVAYPDLYPRYNSSPFRVSGISTTLGYRDECIDFGVSWARQTSDMVTSGTNKIGTVYMFRLELKHLGQVQYRGASGISVQNDSSSGQ